MILFYALNQSPEPYLLLGAAACIPLTAWATINSGEGLVYVILCFSPSPLAQVLLLPMLSRAAAICFF